MKSRKLFCFTPMITLGLVLIAPGCEPDESNESSSSNSSSVDDSEDTPDKTGEDTPDKTDKDTPDKTDEDTADESGDDDDDTPTPDFENRGECRYVAEGEFKDGKYEGKIDYFLIADDGNGEDLCQVQFDVKTVKDSDKPCTDDIKCFWATVVELSNPETIIDVDGYCANSERKMSESSIKDLVGNPTEFSFGDEITGHGHELRAFDEDSDLWVHVTYGNWDMDSGEVTYDLIEGFCRY